MKNLNNIQFELASFDITFLFALFLKFHSNYWYWQIEIHRVCLSDINDWDIFCMYAFWFVFYCQGGWAQKLLAGVFENISSHQHQFSWRWFCGYHRRNKTHKYNRLNHLLTYFIVLHELFISERFSHQPQNQVDCNQILIRQIK